MAHPKTGLGIIKLKRRCKPPSGQPVQQPTNNGAQCVGD